MSNRLRKVFDLVDADLGAVVTGTGDFEWYTPLRDHLAAMRTRYVTLAGDMRDRTERCRQLGLLPESERAELAESYALRVVYQIDLVKSGERLAGLEVYVGDVRKAAAFGGCWTPIDDGLLRMCVREFLAETPVDIVRDHLVALAEEGAA